MRKALAGPVARTSAFFWFQFTPTAVANLGLPLWLAERGVSPSLIGLVNAAPLFASVCLSLSVGKVADRAGDWRRVLVLCSLVAAVAPLLMAWTRSPWAIGVVWTVTTVPFLVMTPVADAAAIRVAGAAGRSYGSIRVYGTLGFVAATVVAGFAFQSLGVAVFVPLLVLSSALRLAFAVTLPPLRAAGAATAPPLPRPFAVDAVHKLGQLMRPWFLAPIAAGALLSASHSAQNGFGPLIWRSQGVPDWLIGVYLAIAPTAEIAAMLLSHRVLNVMPARALLLCCCLIGTARWCGYASPRGVMAISLLQTLHLVTYGFGYVAVVVFAGAWSDASISAQTQSLASLLRGVALILAYAALGALTARIGAGVFYVSASMCLVGAALCAWSLVVKPARRAVVPTPVE
jgi:MFS transporter, PPP family, 3-phenylpropionic acid transporter